MDAGWHQVAFERELKPGLTRLSTKDPLVALQSRKGVRIFDANCPHRGADLGVVGSMDTDAIVCGFHGRRVGLGSPCTTSTYFVREYETLAVSGLLFVRIAGPDNGFRRVMEILDRSHYFTDGYTMTARVRPDLVVENGFDQTHFRAVHDIRNEPVLAPLASVDGEFAVGGTFAMPASAWQQHAGEVGVAMVPYTARAYSGGVILAHLGGADPYLVITCATLAADDTTAIRLTVAVPHEANSKAPSADHCKYLLQQSRAGLTKDIVIWESLIGDGAPSGEADDAIVRSFRQYLSEMRCGQMGVA